MKNSIIVTGFYSEWSGVRYSYPIPLENCRISERKLGYSGILRISEYTVTPIDVDKPAVFENSFDNSFSSYTPETQSWN